MSRIPLIYTLKWSETLDIPLLEPAHFCVIAVSEMSPVHILDHDCLCWGWKGSLDEKAESLMLPEGRPEVRGQSGG